MTPLDRARRLHRPALLVDAARRMAAEDCRPLPSLDAALAAEAEIDWQRRNNAWRIWSNAAHVAALALVIRATRAEAAAPLSLVK